MQCGVLGEQWGPHFDRVFAGLNSANRLKIALKMPRLSKVEGEVLAKNIVHFFENSADRVTSKTVHHFVAEGYRERTIRSILSRYLKEGRVTQKQRGGRPATVCTQKVVRKAQNFLDENPNISIRCLADKLKIAKSTVSDLKRLKLGYRTKTAVTAPKYQGTQAARAKTGCRKIYRNLLLKNKGSVIVMDNETYVPLDPEQIPGAKFYHEHPDKPIAEKYKVKSKEKFPKKFLVWQCIDENGHVSKPFISMGTINAQTYKVQCLQKRLLPFLRKHNIKEKALFWPDLATSHYAGAVVDFLRKHKIRYVTKLDNAPNVPQARPIERYWDFCKQEYKRRGKQATGLTDFTRMWRSISRKVAQKSAKTLMKNVRGKLRAVAYKSVYAPLRISMT